MNYKSYAGGPNYDHTIFNENTYSSQSHTGSFTTTGEAMSLSDVASFKALKKGRFEVLKHNNSTNTNTVNVVELDVNDEHNLDAASGYYIAYILYLGE